MSVEKETVIAVLNKNQEEEVRVTQVVISGRDYISIGVFLKDGGVFRRGVTLAPFLVSELVPVLTKALETAHNERP